MKPLRDIKMCSLRETYRRSLRDWPGAIKDLGFNLYVITFPVTAPLIWSVMYLYRQLRTKP